MTKKQNKKKQQSELPFVSICTPTFNRRPFIPFMIKCFEHQTYPKDRMEWIIIDDGTDKIEDLVAHIPQVKYFKYDQKLYLGKKRNLAHEHSKGDIIVYMDDDDYYPPMRVSHAVEMLQKTPNALCAGSSEMHIYFKHINQMYKFGPYGPNHSTAATFAFRRELLSQTKYEETAAIAEEKHFLKNYTIPFVQLDITKTILVFSHIHNSFDKKTMLNDAPNKFVTVSNKTVSDFIKEPELKQFYTEVVDTLLETYEPGKPEHKPDVLKQMEQLKQKREAIIQQQQQQQKPEVLVNRINEMTGIIQRLLAENGELKNKIVYLEGTITKIIKDRTPAA
jgi:hypothetical protein